MAEDQLRPSDFLKADGLEDWRIISDGACIHFRTHSLADAGRLVQRIGEIADVEGHPPAIDVRRGGVTIRLITLIEGYAGMTQRDIEIARQVSAIGKEMGLTADPTAIQGMLVIPGAPDVRAVMPFWRAVLGYEPRVDSPDEDLVDPRDRNVPFWFENMDEPRADGGGAIHVAVWLPYEQVEARVQAALAAGGHMVREDAPSSWTLADAAGNEADVATISGRG